jgi:dTDP-glucose 4,6-dehydratase
MPRAIVTGGAGFLGSHLCDRLLSEGYDVVAFDNLLTGSADNIAHLIAEPRFRYINYDVTEYLYVDGPVDAVFHFASPASPVDFPTKPIHILKVNSYGTHRALGLARAKGARFIVASTSEVYGDPLVHPQNEEYWGNVNPIGVRGVYDEAKRFGEALTMAYRRYHGVDTKIVRIFNTFGPKMRLNDGRVVPNFVGQALRGEPITVYGTGNQTRSFCYVADLIDGIYRLSVADKSVSGPINIGNPTERTMLEFAQEIKRLTNSPSEIVFQPLPTADDPKQRRPDITKAQSVLGWEPKVTLEEGLKKTIEYFQSKLAEAPANGAS